MALKNKRILIVGGARPNFVKIAPLYREFRKRGATVTLVNAGQHYTASMNASFFKEFGMKANVVLHPSKNDPSKQFADMLEGIGRAIRNVKPALVIVVGDVNATLAATLAAQLYHVPVAHVEAGLRSFNSAMLEERNRILVDHSSELLFATEESGMRNLKREGLAKKSFLVGNIMIDAAELFAGKAKKRTGKFYFCTLHRAENVDNKKTFAAILKALSKIAKDAPIYLPLHPRTEKKAKEFGLMQEVEKIFRLLPPLPYTETLGYERDAALVLTDSGGMQEETTFFGTPCLTLRDETERPVTVMRGTNVIAGTSEQSILTAYRKRKKRTTVRIPLWDGNTAKRIADIIGERI
jgi:UDP-N-acetylglucosamine 2-epimerase (non-hydrolysing)